MEGGQTGTYLRLTRVSSGSRVASLRHIEMKQKKMNISARSQWPSSAVEYRRLKQNFKCRQGMGGMWGFNGCWDRGRVGIGGQVGMQFQTGGGCGLGWSQVSISVNHHIPPLPRQHLKYRFSLLYSTAEEGHCDLAKIFIFVSFHLYMGNMGNACYYSLEKILLSRLLSKKLKYYTTGCIVWLWNLVPHLERGT